MQWNDSVQTARTAAVGIALALLLTATVLWGAASDPAIAARSTPAGLPEGFSDCGENIPPSGTYVNLTQMKAYEWDCEDLSDVGVSVMAECAMLNGVPLYGACALAHSHPSVGVVTKEILVAVTGHFPLVRHEIHNHNDNSYHCQGATGTAAYLAVTFMWITQTCTVAPSFSCNSSHVYWAHGEGYSNPHGAPVFFFGHDKSAKAC